MDFGNQTRTQDIVAEVLGSIIQGSIENAELKGKFTGQNLSEQLEAFFFRKIHSVQPSMANINEPKEELTIDDIKIDDEVRPAPASSSTSIFNKKNKTEKEREKLFEGSSDVHKPKMKSTQEILTKYKFGGDAAAAAAHAKDKLVQRQEKLARISQQSAELQSESENFASLAQQISKSMENKKWWKQ